MIYRVRILRLVIGLFFILLIVRLFYWQVLEGHDLSKVARGQYERGSSILAKRGNILGRDGSGLAVSTDAWLVFATIPDINDSRKKIAERLAPKFIEDYGLAGGRQELLGEIDRIEGLLSKDGVVWVALKQKVDTKTKEKIEQMEIAGIGFEKQEKRFYPEASSSAHILGFVGKDTVGNDTGYFGLEGYYDVSLAGKPGFLVRENDGVGNPIVLGSSKEVDAIAGVDLLTNIDKGIQHALDTKLLDGIQKYGALAGTVIVMKPKDGGILGISAYPAYEPDKYWNYSDEFFSNPAISQSFEPGSIFKVLIMAAALDSKVVEADTKCEICDGPIRVDKYVIETWNKVYHPQATMTDVIVNSDNVGMVYVAQKLGIDRMYEYLKKYGFGEKTGIDLQGEMSPRLRDKKDWGPVELATVGFGQGVAATPIQMLRAVSTIANKGVLMEPHVVDKILSEDWEEDIKPSGGVRVLSEKAASEITSMMVEAAKRGESKWTNLTGFKVAGKTGTAQIPIEGHYDEEKTIASFIGFAPYDNPEFIMLVTLREPISSPWASETAAPLWYEIAKDLFVYFGIQPEN